MLEGVKDTELGRQVKSALRVVLADPSETAQDIIDKARKEYEGENVFCVLENGGLLEV